MNKTVLKFVAGGIGLVAIAVGVLFLVDYIRYRSSPEYRAEQYFKDLERRYREDTYGGATPEETLQLFIDALKKGDVELASKYFVLEKQEGIRTELETGRTNNTLQNFVDILSGSRRGKELFRGSYQFEFLNEAQEVQLTLDLVLSDLTQRWKLVEL